MKKWLFLLLVQGLAASSYPEYRASLECELAKLEAEKEKLTADLRVSRDKLAELNAQEYTKRRPTDCEQRVCNLLYGHLESSSEKTKKACRDEFLEYQFKLSLVEVRIEELKTRL